MIKSNNRLSASRKLVEYLEEQASLDTLRFVTCGSVDDGKSTLIGRMLYEAQAIFDDHIQTLEHQNLKTSEKRDERLNFSLLLDGLEAEQEQGITIDVAYRYFSTKKRKFIITDTPGHKQYTKNMITGASNADVAIILINASLGLLEQTKRHAVICSVLGIKTIVLAVNKMDLIEYDENFFKTIENDFFAFSKKLNFEEIISIPISALYGENILTNSENMAWYTRDTLLGYLENIDLKKTKILQPFRYPVQWISHGVQNYRGIAGLIESGEIKINQNVKILPSGEEAKIKNIFLHKETLDSAVAGQSINIVLDRDLDVSRGDVITCADSPCEIADQIECNLAWFSNESGHSGRQYKLKIGTLETNASITKIKHKIDITTLEKLQADDLKINDLALVTIKTHKPIPFDNYYDCRGLGGFILIDRMNNITVGAGMIKHALRRSTNVHYQSLEINKIARRTLNGHSSKVLWFTGLSGAGKSTLANALEKEFYQKGIRTYILDGDNIRHGLNQDLGFKEFDRIENIRRVAEVAKLMVDAGIYVFVALISPFKTERQMARSLFEPGEFIEIFVDAPIEMTEKRDVKGLYRKAREGNLPNFTGIDSRYEPPDSPEILVDTVNFSVDETVEFLMHKLAPSIVS